jgi:hypothetical protein
VFLEQLDFGAKLVLSLLVAVATFLVVAAILMMANVIGGLVA